MLLPCPHSVPVPHCTFRWHSLEKHLGAGARLRPRPLKALSSWPQHGWSERWGFPGVQVICSSPGVGLGEHHAATGKSWSVLQQKRKRRRQRKKRRHSLGTCLHGQRQEISSFLIPSFILPLLLNPIMTPRVSLGDGGTPTTEVSALIWSIPLPCKKDFFLLPLAQTGETRQPMPGSRPDPGFPSPSGHVGSFSSKSQ